MAAVAFPLPKLVSGLLHAIARLTHCCFAALVVAEMAMVHSTPQPKPSVLKPFLPMSHVNWLLWLLLLQQSLLQLR
jgi:hypothetical protein